MVSLLVCVGRQFSGRAKLEEAPCRELLLKMICFSNINKQYGKQLLFVDASFQLNPGEKVGLVGPNGAGKTKQRWRNHRANRTNACHPFSPGSEAKFQLEIKFQRKLNSPGR